MLLTVLLEFTKFLYISIIHWRNYFTCLIFTVSANHKLFLVTKNFGFMVLLSYSYTHVHIANSKIYLSPGTGNCVANQSFLTVAWTTFLLLSENIISSNNTCRCRKKTDEVGSIFYSRFRCAYAQEWNPSDFNSVSRALKLWEDTGRSGRRGGPRSMPLIFIIALSTLTFPTTREELGNKNHLHSYISPLTHTEDHTSSWVIILTGIFAVTRQNQTSHRGNTQGTMYQV